MAWDSSRPVPWQRLIREWLIYVAIATAAFLVIYRNRLELGLFGGLLASGPMYLGFGALLAKFGYARKTFKDLRNQRAAIASQPRQSRDATVARDRPAPTKRTATGTAQRPNKPRPKRR